MPYKSCRTEKGECAWKGIAGVMPDQEENKAWSQSGKLFALKSFANPVTPSFSLFVHPGRLKAEVSSCQVLWLSGYGCHCRFSAELSILRSYQRREVGLFLCAEGHRESMKLLIACVKRRRGGVWGQLVCTGPVHRGKCCLNVNYFFFDWLRTLS